MWSPNRTTTEGCDIAYSYIKEDRSFSLSLLKRASDLDKALRKYGCVGLEICGQKIVIESPQQYCTFRPGTGGPWKSHITTKVFGDKAVVISAMCLVIMMEQEGYIKDVSVNGTDMKTGNTFMGRENGPLWQTAWSIYLSMKEAENADY